MKVAGIIAEYNPFHKGHQFHMEETRRLTGADYIVVVMSGDYVQRGTPAFLNKYHRTRMALLGGADLVIELPVVFASASAEDFAGCGVSLLKHTGVVDTLSFGSEAGETKSLLALARVLLQETPEMSLSIQGFVKKGMTYPEARAAMILELFGEEYQEVLASPNNILGLEYCKAILKQNADMVPYTIQRKSAGYHDLSMDREFSSASGIRTFLKEADSANAFPDMAGSVPEFCRELLSSLWKKEFPLWEEDFSTLLGFKLMQEMGELTNYSDVSGELAQRIRRLFSEYDGFDAFADRIKTRQYTRTRIHRTFLHILLQITKEETIAFRQADYCSYLRILGFKKEAGALLSALKAHADLPVITKMADANTLLSPLGACMLQKEVAASNLYRMVTAVKFQNPALKNEYTQGIQML